MNKDKLEQALNKIKGMLILMGGGYNVPSLYGSDTVGCD